MLYIAVHQLSELYLKKTKQKRNQRKCVINLSVYTQLVWLNTVVVVFSFNMDNLVVSSLFNSVWVGKVGCPYIQWKPYNQWNKKNNEIAQC